MTYNCPFPYQTGFFSLTDNCTLSSDKLDIISRQTTRPCSPDRQHDSFLLTDNYTFLPWQTTGLVSPNRQVDSSPNKQWTHIPDRHLDFPCQTMDSYPWQITVLISLTDSWTSPDRQWTHIPNQHLDFPWQTMDSYPWQTTGFFPLTDKWTLPPTNSGPIALTDIWTFPARWWTYIPDR